MFGKKEKVKKAQQENEKHVAEMKAATREYLSAVNYLLGDKADYEINWLDFGKYSYETFYRLAEKFPEIEDIANWHPVSKIGPERVYEWQDEYGDWHSWSYDEMHEHLISFVCSDIWGNYRKRFAEMYPGEKLRLEDIGFCGGGPYWLYEHVAYLSYAYWTKDWQNEVNLRLNNWLAK